MKKDEYTVKEIFDPNGESLEKILDMVFESYLIEKINDKYSKIEKKS